MTHLKILSDSEKQQVEKKLDNQFGIKKINGMILMQGQERMFLFTGSLNEREIRQLGNLATIERLGVYFAKDIQGKIKLSIEGTQILGNQITKNIFQLNEQQAEQWMMGRELLLGDIFGSDNNIKGKNSASLSSKTAEGSFGREGGNSSESASWDSKGGALTSTDNNANTIRVGSNRAGTSSTSKEQGTGDFLIIKHNNDFLGCGKASENKIGNFIPKSRRLREKG